MRTTNLLNAEVAARDAGELSLADALAFCLAAAAKTSPSTISPQSMMVDRTG